MGATFQFLVLQALPSSLWYYSSFILTLVKYAEQVYLLIFFYFLRYFGSVDCTLGDSAGLVNVGLVILILLVVGCSWI